MATIRKRQGKWQVQVRHIGHKQISKTFNRKQEAEQWARELEVSFDQNKFDHKVIELPNIRYRLLNDTPMRSQRRKGGTYVRDISFNQLAKTDLAQLKLRSN